MNRNGKIYWWPLMALTLPLITVACTENEQSEQNGNIRFKNEVKALAITRGAVTKITTLDSYGVSAGVHPENTTYADGPCGNYFHNIKVLTESGETNHLWPANGYKISFYAYAPYDNENISLASPTTKGKMKYIYTVPEDISKQVDFMTAEVLDITCPSSETVNLEFHHRLVDFRFRLENSTTEDVTINSLTVKNFSPTGTLTGNSWETANTTKDYTLTINKELPSGTSIDLTGTDKHFLLIPQTLTAGKRLLDLYVTSGGENKHFYSDLTQDFTTEPGKSYQFNMHLTSDLVVSQETSIEDWVLYIGILNYATGTIPNWEVQQQPIEHITTNTITDWVRQN